VVPTQEETNNGPTGAYLLETRAKVGTAQSVNSL